MMFEQIIFFILTVSLNIALSELNHTTTTTEKFHIIVTEKPKESLQLHNNTIDKLVNQQTDLIKKIISNHRATTLEYPIVTRKEIQIKESPQSKQETRSQTLEELQQRCRELFKMSMANKNLERISTVDESDSLNKPDVLQKPQSFSMQRPPFLLSTKMNQEEYANNKKYTNYFILTRNRTESINSSDYYNSNPTETSKNVSYENQIKQKTTHAISPVQTVQYPLHSNIKYVQLEPIILQKMILNNGRMLFYWYKSSPTIPQYLPITQHQPAVQLYPSASPSAVLGEAQNIQGNFQQILKTPINLEQIPEQHQRPNINNKIVPKYEIEYGTTEKTDDNLYKKQMKFVIPLPYPSNNEETRIPTKHPWQFDPYAYYPRHLQPGMVNIPLPYVPTYHMIRTLTIPPKSAKEAGSAQ